MIGVKGVLYGTDDELGLLVNDDDDDERSGMFMSVQTRPTQRHRPAPGIRRRAPQPIRDGEEIIPFWALLNPTPGASTKKASKPPQLSTQEIQQIYSRYQSDLQSLASKIGELEQEAEEHSLVLSTLDEALAEEPDRKCFRLIGGILVERTVKEVVPALQTNRDNIRKVISTLAEQYKTKEEEFDKFKQEFNIRPVG